MLKVDAKIKAQTDGIASKVGKIAKDNGLGTYLAVQAAKGMDQFVPMRTGALAASVRTSPFKVVYSTPYASKVYHGVGTVFRQDKHPNATALWDVAYVASGGAKELGNDGTAYLGRL